MKYFLLGLCCVGLAHATVFRSKIYDIDLSRNQVDPHLLKLENGRVAYLKPDSKLLPSVETHYEYQSEVGLELNEKNEVVGMTVFYSEEKPRGGTRCSDRKSYHPKACAGFSIP